MYHLSVIYNLFNYLYQRWRLIKLCREVKRRILRLNKFSTNDKIHGPWHDSWPLCCHLFCVLEGNTVFLFFLDLCILNSTTVLNSSFYLVLSLYLQRPPTSPFRKDDFTVSSCHPLLLPIRGSDPLVVLTGLHPYPDLTSSFSLPWPHIDVGSLPPIFLDSGLSIFPTLVSPRTSVEVFKP